MNTDELFKIYSDYLSVEGQSSKLNMTSVSNFINQNIAGLPYTTLMTGLDINVY